MPPSSSLALHANESIKLSLPVDASADTLQDSLRLMGYGDTVVNRTARSWGCYTWDIEFLEMTKVADYYAFPEIQLGFDDAITTGVPSFSFTSLFATRFMTHQLMLNGARATLANSVTSRVSSLAVSGLTSSDEFRAALYEVGAIAADWESILDGGVSVVKMYRPSGGYSFIVEFLTANPS